ncbi:glycosyl hydrolase family 28-related protein [Tistrella mobilis]|uniref:glycosyl hydrolase family 28-related protein n=1 Tax=Tistrella mobilis TaxID=171437 RepID=UPI0031F60277
MALAGTILGTIADLRAFTGAADAASVLGYYAAGDSGGGDFVWNATLNTADNGGTIIKPTASSGAGRWVRLLPQADTVDVRMFGAKGDGVTDDHAAITAAIAVLPTGGTLIFPNGTYAISSTVVVDAAGTARHSLNFKGIGNDLTQPLIACDTASTTLFDVSIPRTSWQGLRFQGDGATYGVGATTTAISFASAGQKDVDALITGCGFGYHAICIRSAGTNIQIWENTFSNSIVGIDVMPPTGSSNPDECRGNRIERNRFHSLGGNSTDTSVADSVCVRIDTPDAYANTISANYADDSKAFFKGQIDRSSLDDNRYLRAWGRFADITYSGSGWSISNNMIDGQNTIAAAPSTAVQSEGILTTKGVSAGRICGNTIHVVRRNGIQCLGSFNLVSGNVIFRANAASTYDGSIYDGLRVAGIANTVTGNSVHNGGLAGSTGNVGIEIDSDAAQTVMGVNQVSGYVTPVADGDATTRGFAISFTNGARRMIWDTAIPTTGTWRQGDVVWNIAPTTGAAAGWTCTASGSPGSWTTIATL